MTTETTNDPIAPNAPASIAAAASQPSELPAESPVYQAFKLPDGMSIDEQALSEAMALFQQARLDQTTAQKFVDLAMAREQAVHRRNAQAFNDLQEKWTGEIKSDPDIGGDRLAASLVAAARARSPWSLRPARGAERNRGRQSSGHRQGVRASRADALGGSVPARRCRRASHSAIACRRHL